MTNYKKLYKLIDGLNNKIKKLESSDENFYQDKNILSNKSIERSKIESYRIHMSTEFMGNKKYIGLMFDSNFNNFDNFDNFDNNDNSGGKKNLSPFIILQKSNIIINYFIQLELNYTPITPVLCSLALGIRTKTDSKIKIIKGTKNIFDVTSSNVILGNVTLTNTFVYMSGGQEELCIIVDLGSVCRVNPKKSLIKLLYFY